MDVTASRPSEWSRQYGIVDRRKVDDEERQLAVIERGYLPAVRTGRLQYWRRDHVDYAAAVRALVARAGSPPRGRVLPRAFFRISSNVLAGSDLQSPAAGAALSPSALHGAVGTGQTLSGRRY
ncbi:hypothetical protein Nepgr_017678 [Nepenthes gracilis]|uniref:Uncharacterized protein n=1 Tax=Nepenthes gracilis TaxID=150966 RepID=A0AAD3XSD4_NEPGR|nr:hypothetical protein Nepgr_017678 [Nepenthes gracilis]